MELIPRIKQFRFASSQAAYSTLKLEFSIYIKDFKVTGGGLMQTHGDIPGHPGQAIGSSAFSMSLNCEFKDFELSPSV
jgi:hypothetical protein